MLSERDRGTPQRSQSIDCLSNRKENRLVPLIRAVHLLGVKVRKHKYFFFCRLENLAKECKSLQSTNSLSTPGRNFDKDIDIFEASLHHTTSCELGGLEISKISSSKEPSLHNIET